MKLTTTGALSGALQLRFTVANASTYSDEPRTFNVLNLMSEEVAPMAAATGNRPAGVANFAVNFEPGGQAPLDARTLVPTKADLIAPATYSGKNYYQGMTVTVLDDGGKPAIYVLKDVAKITSFDYSGWQRMDASASVSEEEIYKLPGDILTLTEDSSEAQANAILGTASNWKKAFDAKKVFVSNTSIGLITLNPYLYGFSVFYYEDNKPILLYVSLN